MTGPTEPELEAIMREAGVRWDATGELTVPDDVLRRFARLVWAARRSECAGFARRKPQIVPDLNLDTGSPLQ